MPRAASRRAQAAARRFAASGAQSGQPGAGGPAGAAGAGANAVTARGIVLSAGRLEWAVAWAKRGLGPLIVAPLDGWTLIVAAGPPLARPPYDDPVRTLAGRPVGFGMRPAIGLFQVGRQAVVTVQAGRWRPVHRWAIWTRHDALVNTPDLPVAGTSDMIAVAGSVGVALLPGAEPALRALWHDGSIQPAELLDGTFRLLGLPGMEVLTGERPAAALPGARAVEPHPRHARAFDKLIEEQARERAEQEAP